MKIFSRERDYNRAVYDWLIDSSVLVKDTPFIFHFANSSLFFNKNQSHFWQHYSEFLPKHPQMLLKKIFKKKHFWKILNTFDNFLQSLLPTQWIILYWYNMIMLHWLPVFQYCCIIQSDFLIICSTIITI